MANSRTVKLKHPLTEKRPEIDGGDAVKEVTISEITLTRMKAKHLRAGDKATGDIGYLLAVISANSGVKASTLDELDAEDMEAVVEAAEHFLPKRPATGAR